MATRRLAGVVVFFVGLGLAIAGQGPAGNKPPVIKHAAVTVAIKGQPISVRASVMDDAGVPRSVTLYYSTSQDVAPFKVSMQDTGAGVYMGTIPGGVLGGIAQVSYYIEAMDDRGAGAETPWYRVPLKAADDPAVVGLAAAGAQEEEWSGWKTAAIVGGVVVAAAGVAVVASSSGGGGGDEEPPPDGGDSTATNAGVYSGSATVCLEMTGEAASCSSRAVTFTVTDSGVVSSDTLEPGQYMQASLVGSGFTMAADIDENGVTGQIEYQGTVIDGRVSGVVAGTATRTDGTTGNYYGTFYATRF